ncbi:kama family protein [Bimuria novae-zelandiae CBS 107.79]|uniref:Kama family protein n=1 Tax=Bimuria novae-zelandiae CBS 107.79 TaxID=1447943 RepID=A0A6A5VMW7_9PLEO|nr:kama family protein [Bimuria novae-zelandiae CBS 107.79]
MAHKLLRAQQAIRNGFLTNLVTKRALGTAPTRAALVSARVAQGGQDAKQITSQAHVTPSDRGAHEWIDYRPLPSTVERVSKHVQTRENSNIDEGERSKTFQALSDSFASVQAHQVAELHKNEEDPYWTRIPLWSEVSADDFISQSWQVRHSVDKKKIERFLLAVLPDDELPLSENPLLQHIHTKQDFIREAKAALEMAPMTIKLTPYILSCINWKDPLNDPIRVQFIPLKSSIVPDHPSLTLDSLGEEGDSPVPGLVHRYPGRALFLATSICPVYCSFCTRAYAVGPETSSTDKKPQKPSGKRWEAMFEHIEKDVSIKDIVVSGGDTYMLLPEQLRLIGERLLSIPHIRRFRIASKGFAVNPCRILDNSDAWASTLVDLARQGRKIGKQVCWHTHFNHPNEITWITKKAALHLCQQGLVVRNQSVLLKGVNDDPETMGTLIKALADMNIEPYYVYICDLVRGIEHLRTPLRTLLYLDKELRGKLTGFMMPDFVVDLPGGGGKRLAHTYESYVEETGVSTWTAPGLDGDKGRRTYTYYDPLPWVATAENVLNMREQQDLMHKHRSTRKEDFMKDDGSGPLVATACAA